MKRSKPLKRGELKRGTSELKRTGFQKRSAPLQRSQLRSPRPAALVSSDKGPASSTTRRSRARRRAVPDVEYRRLTERVMVRDGVCVARRHGLTTPCFGGLHPHHVWPSGQGGPDHENNLWSLCAGHHRFVHGNPDWSKKVGLLATGPPPGGYDEGPHASHHLPPPRPRA